MERTAALTAKSPFLCASPGMPYDSKIETLVSVVGSIPNKDGIPKRDEGPRYTNGAQWRGALTVLRSGGKIPTIIVG